MEPDPTFRPYRSIQAKTRPLQQLLPLAVPYGLHIDPANICNFQCRFCPTGHPDLLKHVARPQGRMDLALFRKIIDDLVEMNAAAGEKPTKLHLYKDGEPLLNPHLPEMIRYAREKDAAESIETTTNGALLTPEVTGALLDAGLDVMRISVEHVTDAGYKRITGVFGDYGRIKNNIRGLFEEKERRNSPLMVFVKILDVGLTRAEKEQFVQDIKPISDALNIDRPMGWNRTQGHDFTLGLAADTAMDGVTALQERLVCPEPFSKMAINIDGRVSVCCVDWSLGTVVGDVRTEHLSDIWQGARLNQFRLTHLRGRRPDIDVCADCQYIQGFPEYSFLDDHAAELIPLYEPEA